MTGSQTIHIAGIGPVLFEHSTRARRIVIAVRPPHGVRVAVPYRASFKSALAFVELKKGWILKHLERLRQREAQQPALGPLSVAGEAAARTRIIQRLQYLAGKHGFSYGRVTIRRQKTRWGSCSARNNFSLNIKLALLPADLMDYVILHELVHTRIHNHGKGFWAELDNYVGNARQTSRRLKEYGLELY